MADIATLVNRVVSGELSGDDLKNMMERDEITKTDRRKITKLAKSKKEKLATMSDRQKLRLEVKEKKKLPKITRDEREARFRKDLDSEREKEAANFTICLNCRKRGHYVKDCPKLKTVQPAGDGLFCYNCGSYNHALRHCTAERDPNGSLPYAQCYICKQSGHLARNCPTNSHGLYPKGGCCFICGKIDHLARDCPDRPPTEETRPKDAIGEVKSNPNVSDDAYVGDYEEVQAHEEQSDEEDNQKKKRRRK